jgi:hypothetical protein
VHQQLSATVRAIEYEIVPKFQIENIGLPSTAVDRLGTQAHVGVLRCVDDRGDKVTVVGDAGRLRELLSSGEASDPAGMQLAEREFPVVVRGWLQAS